MKKIFTFIFIVVLLLLAIVIKFSLLKNNNSSVIELPIIKIDKIIESDISILPRVIIPGDPVFITINSSSTPKEIFFDDKDIPIFNYNNKFHAFIGIDFNEKVIKHTVKVLLNNSQIIIKPIILTMRPKIEKPLDIPNKLGGNTKEAENNLLTNLAKENYILNIVQSTTTSLWTNIFIKPLTNLIVTDDYGYNRKTVNSTIVHKGTDFHAPVGTEVMAMNDGIVRIARSFIIYGNAVVIDHGLGLQTLYMHLSKINVKEGDMVKAGQVIGLSGQTGYADQPHLHISVKINKISIDPVIFLGFWGI